MSDFFVSIFMLTYNQEELVAQTIQSILQQKTSFKYQLVIGEDFSTDNTRSICEKYASENPDKIKLLPTLSNVGLINNFIRTYKECDGKYVAICDGDDYWIDPLKLQKQIDFLEDNPDYNLIFTSFNFLSPEGRITEKDYSNQSLATTFEDLIFGNYISSVTAVFRNKKTPTDFPEWLDSCPYGDWPLYLWTTKDGAKIKYIEDVTAVYRREIGVSEKMKLVPSRISLVNLNILENINKDIHFRLFSSKIEKSLKNHRFQLLSCYIRELRLLKMVKLTGKIITKSPMAVFKLYAYIIKGKLYINFIPFFRNLKKILSRLLYKNRVYNKIIFQRIYKKDLFNKVQIQDRSESKSGPGSSLIQAKELFNHLPLFFKKYGVKSMLDVPCGDFYWMQKINLNGINYTGGDIVPEIIKNNYEHTTNSIQFKRIDILNDRLPKVDLILCRDLFVHLTNEQIFRALKNIRASGSKYLLLTSYKSRLVNKDIAEIGQWRTLNMEVAPFFLDQKIDEIFENCTEGNMAFNDKYLLMFEIQEM